MMCHLIFQFISMYVCIVVSNSTYIRIYVLYNCPTEMHICISVNNVLILSSVLPRILYVHV